MNIIFAIAMFFLVACAIVGFVAAFGPKDDR